jgi:aminopeptidase N
VVAGDLALSEDSFVTANGNTVTLRLWTEAKDIGKVQFAMDSLKRAMK